MLDGKRSVNPNERTRRQARLGTRIVDRLADAVRLRSVRLMRREAARLRRWHVSLQALEAEGGAGQAARPDTRGFDRGVRVFDGDRHDPPGGGRWPVVRRLTLIACVLVGMMPFNTDPY